MQVRIRSKFLLSALLALWALSGCATIAGKSHQNLHVDVLDAADRPVAGMSCRISHASRDDTTPKAGLLDTDVTVTTPAHGIEVRRSSQAMFIECRKGQDVATATVRPRRDGLEQALVPFGSVAVFIDHVSGGLYAYPTDLSLRLGQHVELEHGETSRVMKAEAIEGAATLLAAPPLQTGKLVSTSAARSIPAAGGLKSVATASTDRMASAKLALGSGKVNVAAQSASGRTTKASNGSEPAVAVVSAASVASAATAGPKSYATTLARQGAAPLTW